MPVVTQKLVLWSSWSFELLKEVLIVIVSLILVHYFVGTIFIVEGSSMEPNLHDGQFIVVEKFSHLVRPPQRGEVIVLQYPGDPEHRKYIKRIIGLPQEKIEIKSGQLYINDKKLDEIYLPASFQTQPDMVKTLAAGEYFTLGDNRPFSNDSRVWGTLPQEDIVGKAVFVLYPIKTGGFIPKTPY